MTIDKIKDIHEKRFNFLRYAYEKSEGNINAFFPLDEFKQNLELTQQ